MSNSQCFFIADILQASPKCDLASMEHPLFALKAGDKRARTYERNGTIVEVQPGLYGCATIHDKDVWVYCISQLVEAMNRERGDISRTVRFIAYDFFEKTNRSTSGVAYKRLYEALRRLSGTRIETNIKTAGKCERSSFGLVDSWRVIERHTDGRMMAVEVTLPDWLFRAIQTKRVLTLSQDYFQIRKPLDRRIYELARKHCGAQPKWRASVVTLYEKSGSTDVLRNFRGAIKILSVSNKLPGYHIIYNAADDIVTFYARSEKGKQAMIHDRLGGLRCNEKKVRDM